MSGMIKDGTGKGFLAKVNADNKLFVLASTHTEEHTASITGANAYFANSTDTADTLTFADATAGPILYLKNDDPDADIVVEKIVCSADAAGGVLKFMRNMTLGTIGANNVHTPVNSNFGSSNTVTATSYNWDESGTTGMDGLTNGTAWKSFIMGAGTTFFPVDGTISIPKGSSVTINFANNTGSAIEFECGIRFYLDKKEEN